jgi:hypothetical protein
MPTTFHRPLNGVATTVAAPRAVAAVVVVAAGTGTRFGSIFPLIVTAARGDTDLSILEVTGRAGDVLTISGAIEGTADVALEVGDRLEMRATAGAVVELQDAVHALEAIPPGDLSYVHVQGTAAPSWTIAHNLGKYPSVSVVDSAGSWWIGDVTYININTVRVDFGAGFSGKAFLN